MSDAAAQPTGSSILTSGIPPPAPVTSGQNGTPPASANGQSDPIADARQAAMRPDWAPEKYWDAEKASVRTEDLAKGYVNLEKLLGSEKVPKPLSEDDAEGWDRWYTASGRPGKLEDYEFKRPDKLPDGLNYDEELEKDFRATAYSAGMNKKQAGVLYEKFVKGQIDRYQAYSVSQAQSRQKAEADLRTQFGGQYDAALTQAKTAMQTYADAEFRKWLDESGQGNNPAMIRTFMKIGKEMQGDTRVQGKVEPAMNMADMERTIREFEAKNTKALYDGAHPDHAYLVKERNRLYEAAFPSVAQ